MPRGRGAKNFAQVSAELLGADMSEKELDARIEKIRIGYRIKLSYHTYRSDRSESGFPDRFYLGRYGLLIRELKTDTGIVAPKQQEWLDEFTRLGLDAGVWRTADLHSGRIDRELRAIAVRSPFL